MWLFGSPYRHSLFRLPAFAAQPLWIKKGLDLSADEQKDQGLFLSSLYRPVSLQETRQQEQAE